MTEALAEHIAAARSGDCRAFGEIWRILAPRVSGYVRGRGVDSFEDVTSEVFLAAFAGLPRFHGDAQAFRSWLFTIAHHKAVDALRRQRPALAYTPERDTRAVPSAEDSALAGRSADDLRRLLEPLTPAQRDVILLRVLADLDIETVAAVTGSTPAAVRQLTKRAVTALRRTIRPSERIPHPRVPGGRASTITESS